MPVFADPQTLNLRPRGPSPRTRPDGVPVVAIGPDVHHVFPSIRAASQAGHAAREIRRCLAGKRLSHHGLVWREVESKG